jgi:peptide/nickel transport system substrate-binding protein
MVSLVLLGSAAMVWAGGEDEGSSESSSAGAMTASGSYNEAPALAQLVASGDLPPVEERLPPEPLVVQVKDEIGQYGGSITAIKHSTGNWYMIAHVNIEPLMELDPVDSLNVVPNVARAWDWNDDKSQLTVHLREGIKWSDGSPFTAEDLRFYYEDVQFNEKLTPLTPGAWMSHGSRMTFTQIDDSTVQFGFAGPSPAQLFMFTAANGYMNHYYPAHYFKELHIDYNEDADKKAKEEGLEEWWQLFNQTREKTRPYIHYPGPPYLYAWIPTSVTMDRTVWDRNPYYWKVDAAGNQLPYLDNIYGVLVVESELVKARGIAGEFDFLVEGFGMDEAPLLEQNAERYNYNVIIGPNTWAGAGSYYLNLNHKDPVRRELYRDKRFRQALSHAIDRDEINELVYLEQGVPRQATVISGSPLFKEEYASSYAEYDPASANALLDEMGLTERDGDGFRLRPDGDTLALTINIPEGVTDDLDAMEIITENWRTIGVKAAYKPLERSLFRERVYSGEAEVGTWLLDRSQYPFEPIWFIPTSQHTYWAPKYGTYYASGGTSGEKPPAELQRLVDIWEEIKVTTDTDRKNALFQEVLDAHQENVWIIGVVGETPQLVVVKNNFRNVPEKSLYAWSVGHYLGLARIEQFFFKQ